MAYLYLIDDDKLTLDAYKRILSFSGYEVRIMESGNDALEAMRAEESRLPDVIVADIVMPTMSGFELLEAMRIAPDWPDIPFIFISANAKHEVRSQLAKYDKVDFVRKPVDVSELFLALSLSLAPRTARMTAATSARIA